MVDLQSNILILLTYHLVFFYDTYFNPYRYSRSELLSTFFSSLYIRGKYDLSYWLVPNAHPVLSRYYPITILQAFLSRVLDRNKLFRLFLYSITIHHAFASIGWFLLVRNYYSPEVALFGAITFTYAGYCIKQQPCVVYTIGWFSWLVLGIATQDLFISTLSMTMILLSGYYPIALQMVLIVFFIHALTASLSIPLGILLSIPQLLPFLRYLPKTIRTKDHGGKGKTTIKDYLGLVVPELLRYNTDLGFWEKSCYIGLTPVILIAVYHTAKLETWILLVTGFFLSLGFFSKYFPRIPSRWLFTVQFCLCLISISSLNSIHLSSKLIYLLCVIQMVDLYIRNSNLIPTTPYCELWKSPNWAFRKDWIEYVKENIGDGRISGLPYPSFTGNVHGLKTLGYSGGMQNKLMSKWRNDLDPHGSGEHDYFKYGVDNKLLDSYRVKFAYSRKRLDRLYSWKTTPFKHLYRNPRLCER